MVREIVISVYLFFFKWVFAFFNLFPLKEKTTFVVSFGDNSKYVLDEMRRQGVFTDVVFLCKGKKLSSIKNYDYVTRFQYDSCNLLDLLKAIYHLATSRHILVDNYYGFLAVTKFKPNVKCIQLWHATGAIKKFGLQDQSVEKRSANAKKRFHRVYRQFDKVVVGSDRMAEIFKEAFDLKDSNILKTGVPRTDFFYNEKAKRNAINKLFTENKILQNKKVILYAPTYRDNKLDNFKLQLDIEKMKKELGEDYILILRLHPAVKMTEDYSEKYPGFIFNYSSSGYHINHLMLVTDYLVTDYSSIPYEFSLLRKPMIFFTYDLETYKKERGIWGDLEANFPGPIVKNTESLIEVIKKDNFDLEIVESYANTWNKYSKGCSSNNLVTYLFDLKGSEIKGQSPK